MGESINSCRNIRRHKKLLTGYEHDSKWDKYVPCTSGFSKVSFNVPINTYGHNL